LGKIHVLDQNTVNQIAAGEVVDRPSSVVKELLENAIDAGATAITVEIRDGGLSLIRITDNGSGIAADDLHNAFVPHATSKITDAADLVSVSSLGFRGEALSSIASVCRVELITKTRDSITGVSYKIEGGEEVSLEEIGAPDGTTFLVKDIFYNTPARRKFLKTAQTEGLYISELVERIAMSRPDISFRLIMNGQNKLYTSGNGKLRDVIYTVFGKEIAANLLPVKLKLSGLSMNGFIGKPVISRGNRSFEIYFINGRYVKSKVLYKAIEDAYKPYMMQHKYPFTVLMLDIPPELLDVNVHPAKMELRFRQEEALYQEIKKALDTALREKELVVEAHLPEARGVPEMRGVTEAQSVAETPAYRTANQPHPQRRPEPFEALRKLAEVQRRETIKADANVQEAQTLKAEPTVEEQPLIPVPEKQPTAQAEPEITDAVQMELFDDRLLSKQARSRHRLIGQLFGTYWLIEYEEKLFIIDQHAAHEKVLYERTMKQMQEREAVSQLLQPSIMLHLTERQRVTLEEYMEYFNSLGFEIEPFGGNTYAVSALPANLFSLNQVDLLIELIDDLSEEVGHNGSQTIMDKVASMSCKAAVKGHTTLTTAEADALIDELLTLENPYACPHGRPTIISMTRYEIEKKFKRIV
jgi:DNA mismatch repair protein MutL